MKTIDLNCDMGEGSGNDAFIMPFISSANIACGFHAGDEKTMQETIGLAVQYQVAIGAHPSFNDRDNFGRTDMHLPPSQVYDLITQQIHILQNHVKSAGAVLHHVKPHGALYNMAARGKKLASVIALAIKDAGDNLIVYGLSNSHLISEAKAIGLKAAHEVFADRTYQVNGSLTARSRTNALIEDEAESARQVLQMVGEGTVTTVSGEKIKIRADTVCVHSDAKNVVAFVKHLNKKLKENNIALRTIT